MILLPKLAPAMIVYSPNVIEIVSKLLLPTRTKKLATYKCLLLRDSITIGTPHFHGQHNYT